MSALKTFIVIAVLLAVPIVMVLTVRARVRRRPRLRGPILIGGVAAIVLAAIVGLWLPGKVPDTPGSPGTLVAIVVLWFVGAGLCVVGLAGVLGAALAGRTREDAH